MRTNAKGLYGLVPEGSRFGVRAFVIAQLLGSFAAELPLMRHHRVVPGCQTLTQRRRLRGTTARSDYRVQIHATPP
jgi:hypothetical protein